MYKKYKDDLFDSLLALALYESSLSESENYPEDEIEKITLSEECDTKIRKMGRRVNIPDFSNHLPDLFQRSLPVSQ